MALLRPGCLLVLLLVLCCSGVGRWASAWTPVPAAAAAAGGDSLPDPDVDDRVHGRRRRHRRRLAYEDAANIGRSAAALRVQVVTHPNITVPRTHEQLEDFYKDNLYPDFKYWRESVASLGRKLNRQDLKDLLARQRETDTRRIVMIRDNRVYFPYQDDVPGLVKPKHLVSPNIPEEPANAHLKWLWKVLDKWTKMHTTHVKFPNTVFFLNVADHPFCVVRGRHRCPAPLLSVIKQCMHRDPRIQGHPNSGVSWEEGNCEYHDDIMVPNAWDMDMPLSYYPWEKKIPKAFFRGGPFCNTLGIDHALIPGTGETTKNASAVQRWTCPRFFLANMTKTQGPTYPINVAITEVFPPWFKKAPMASMAEHTHYKLLLHLDGISLSSRLHKIMRLNSAVLKEQSRWIEYYSRSLKPFVHYLPFWIAPSLGDGALDTVNKYLQPDQEPLLKKVAAQAQEFAFKYAGSVTRHLYWHKVLTEYNTLFDDMDALIEEELWPRVQAQLRGNQTAAAAP